MLINISSLPHSCVSCWPRRRTPSGRNTGDMWLVHSTASTAPERCRPTLNPLHPPLLRQSRAPIMPDGDLTSPTNPSELASPEHTSCICNVEKRQKKTKQQKKEEDAGKKRPSPQGKAILPAPGDSLTECSECQLKRQSANVLTP